MTTNNTMKTKQPPEPIEITCQQCRVTKLYVEYPIIENNRRAQVCKQCSEIGKAEAAAHAGHQPKIEGNSTIICTCKNCIDLKYINQVRDSITFLIIRLELGSINIPEDLKLLVKNLAYMIGAGTCECEECRSNGGTTKHTRLKFG